jgi:Tol biopolymer transport system component
MSVRSQVRVVVGLGAAMACFASAVPVAEASFPGRNGLIAFAGEGPPFEPKPRGEGAWTIRVVNPRSGRTRQLTHVPRRCGRRGWTWGDYEPSYSASGRLVTYFHEDSCDPRVKDGIYVMRADGSRRRLIREMTADPDDIPEYPVFSPSGEFVAFDQYLGGSYIKRVERRARERNVRDCPRDRCPLWRFAEVQQPAWSPTGRRLALTLSGILGEDVGHIGTVDTRGLNLRLVTRSRRDGMPDWAPKGNRIVFERRTWTGRQFMGNIFTGRTYTSRHRPPRRLTTTRDAYLPAWSPNGRYIAYVRDPNAFHGPGSLWIMRARDGGGQRLVVSRIVTDRISWQPRPPALDDERRAG